MKYYEVCFRISPNSEVATDILSALLADEGFEAFEPSDEGLSAWVQQAVYAQDGVEHAIGEFPLPDTDITYKVSEAPDENWNRQWELDGFVPIVISDEDNAKPVIVIHDTAHDDVPESQYDIRINPCQAFGTGTHETTRMILRQLLSMPMAGRHVVDAGTGTGILAILCRMLGAARVFAYDIDEWSVRNAKDNLLLNGIHDAVDVHLGDSSVLPCPASASGEGAESEVASFSPTLLIANINRNILLADMPRFASCLPCGGELLLSGFYTEDVPVLLSEAANHCLYPVLQQQDANWSLLLLKKEKSY